MTTVGVVDYGMGNLHSVAKALALHDVRPVVSDDPKKLSKTDVLVLPGVGSFGPAMKNLSRRKLDVFIRRWIAQGRPYLGICLGLQLLFDRSEEAPGVRGLGVLRGAVKRFRPSDFPKNAYQVPHMGWNEARPRSGRDKELFKGLKSKDRYYFVHTFYADPKDRADVMTETVYGKRFCSSVRRGSVVATQFHLEKSGEVGLRLLGNLLDQAKRRAA